LGPRFILTRSRAWRSSLIPSGALSPADAHALVRAGELARAFGAVAIAPPEGMVAELTAEARDLLARVRERIVPSDASLTAAHAR
jgi:hypothetical protein